MWPTLGCVVLFYLALLNHRFAKSWLWPPALYAAIWGVTLLSLAILHAQFYELSARTVGIYVLGAISFTIGALFATAAPGSGHTPRGKRPDVNQQLLSRILKAAALLLTLAFPVFLNSAIRLAATTTATDMYAGLREATIRISNTPGGGSISLVDNLPYLSAIFALIALNEQARNRRGSVAGWLVISLALAYQILTAARSGVVMLLVCAAVLMYFHRGRIKAAFIITAACGFLVLSIYNYVTLRKGVDKTYMSPADRALSVTADLIVHAVGGAVAFDQIVQNPDVIPHSHRVTYFFEHELNKVGIQVDEPSRHAQFLWVAPSIDINVYTTYFCYYPDFGVSGVIICTLFLGWIVSVFYSKASHGSQVGAILYATSVNALVLTPIADEFFLSLNFWLKLTIVTSAVYYCASLRRKARTGGRGTWRADIQGSPVHRGAYGT